MLTQNLEDADEEGAGAGASLRKRGGGVSQRFGETPALSLRPFLFLRVSHTLFFAAGRLCITVNSGRVMESDSTFHVTKASDPYVEVRYAGYLCRTHIAHGDNTPTWNFNCACKTNVGEEVCGEGYYLVLRRRECGCGRLSGGPIGRREV